MRVQIVLLLFSEFKQFNQLEFPLESSENHRFSDECKGEQKLICMYLIVEAKFGHDPWIHVLFLIPQSMSYLILCLNHMFKVFQML